MSSVALRIQTTRAADQTFQPTRRHDGRARRLDSRWSELDPPRLERLSLRDAPPHLGESLSEIEQTSLCCVACYTFAGPLSSARSGSSWRSDPIFPYVLANAALLEQVFLNICSNARDALASAQPADPCFVVEIQRSAGGLRIRERQWSRHGRVHARTCV
jgi:signal transduction histidine kinase